MLKANFNITETGGTGIVQLQSSSDAGTTWQNVDSPLTLTHGALTVDDRANVTIDTSVFIPGQTYEFRLVDTAGSPVSNVYTTHIPSITAYATCTGTIGFTNAGGDSWTISLYIAPDHIQNSGGATVVSYDYTIDFWLTGNSTTIDSSTQSADHSVSTSGNGAGVYQINCFYHFSDGLEAIIKRIVKVDGAGNILADVQFNGSTINSVSGLTINETANIVQTGVNYNIEWAALNSSNSGTVLASGATADLVLPTDTVLVIIGVDLSADTVFADYTGDPLSGHGITIS